MKSEPKRHRRFREYLCPIRGKWYIKDTKSNDLPAQPFPGRVKAREHANAMNTEDQP